MVDTVEVSLKGADGLWSGQTDESAIHPTTGRFTRLHNCRVSFDGSEIVRAPGIVKVAEPRYADAQYQITTVTPVNTTHTDLTLTIPAVPQEHFLEPSAYTPQTIVAGGITTLTFALDVWRVWSIEVGDTVPLYFSVLPSGSGTGLSSLVIYTATVTALDSATPQTTVTIPAVTTAGYTDGTGTAVLFAHFVTISGGSLSLPIRVRGAHAGAPTVLAFTPQNAGVTTSSNVFIHRASTYHGLRSVNGYSVAAVESRFYENLDAAAFKRRWGVETFSLLTPLSLSNPNGFLNWTRRRNPILPKEDGIENYWHSPPRRRCVLDVADNRLLVAVAGSSVMLQTQLDQLYNQQMTYCLGLPRPYMFNPRAVLGGDASGAAFWGTAWANGTPSVFSVAAAYKSHSTGEFGLATQTLVVNSATLSPAVGGTHSTPTITAFNDGANRLTIDAALALAVGSRFAFRLATLGGAGTGLSAGTKYVGRITAVGGGATTFDVYEATDTTIVDFGAGYTSGTINVLYNAVAVDVWLPRRLLREIWDAGIVLFVSDAGSSGSAMRALFESGVRNETPDASAANQYYTFFLPGKDWTHDPGNARFPNLEQMPMGASWVKTVRGFTAAGGAMSSTPQGEGYTQSPSKHVERIRVSTVAAQRTSVDFLDDITHPLSTFTGRLAAGRGMPSSFMGAILNIQLPTGNLSPVRLVESHNTNVQRWTFEGGAWNVADVLSAVERDAYLNLFRGHVWYSEQGFPGVMPAVNRAIVDKIQGYDVVAAGRFGDSMVFCSPDETYIITFGRALSPDPQLLSYEHGNAAPNSMVEGDGFAAWMSKQGPAGMAGGVVQFLGRQLSRTWVALERDSLGMMPQATAVYDQRIKTAMFLVRPGAYSGTDDDGRSMQSNSRGYMMSVASRSWSVYQPSVPTKFYGGAPLLFDDGIYRTCFQVDQGDVLAWDEAVYERALTPIVASAITSVTGAPFFIAGAPNTFLDVTIGQEAFVYSADGVNLKWYGTITSTDAPNYTFVGLSLDQVPAVIYNITDKIEIGIIRMELETTFSRFAEGGVQGRRAAKLVGVLLEHDLTKPEGGTPVGFVRVQITDELGNTISLHDGAVGQKLELGRTRVNAGGVSGTELKVKLTFITNGFLKVKDVRLEVAPGG